jgi:ribosomal protein S18 acetylase RimI-like enzyme
MSSSDAVTIHRIRKVEELTETSELFDLYRQFYKEPADANLARKFLSDNLNEDRSIIFLARDSDGKAVGFTQLYPAWCSVAALPFLTLYDLYVDSSARKQGVGRLLMDAALQYARDTGASRIDLETAVDNVTAQALYEALGYERDTHFYKYSLALD